MENKGYYLPQDIYSEHLKQIDGITFTHREIDIIAFLIRGRTAKKIASFLSISPKTVENHTRNIMIKLQCNSRERIIDFIEKSGKFSFVKNYYTTLMISIAFEKSLKAIAASKKEANPVYCLVHWLNQTTTSSLAHQLENHLKAADVPVFREARENAQSLSQLTQEAHQEAYKIYVLPDRTLDAPQSSQDLKDQTHHPVQENFSSLNNCLFLLPVSEKSSEIPKELENVHYVDSAEHQNYYFFVFAVLTKLFPNLNFDKIILEFKETHDALNALSDSPSLQSFSEEKQSEAQKGDAVHEIREFAKKKVWIILTAFLVLGLLAFWVLTYKEKEGNTEENRYKPQPENRKNQHFPPVRSELMIPSESGFLSRPQLIAQIESKFSKKQEGIQVVALVGIGGAGKTTLARQYARTQKSSIVWEINLATQESFVESLKNLAYAISKTEAEKKTLRGFQDIKVSKEREEKIILFLKERIKSYPNWFAIYDNLENASKIQDFFPADPNVWGNGKVLITTRDSNIQNTDQINSTIQIGELNAAEKFNLFVKIFNNGEMKLSSQQKEQIIDFLRKIPPFPLDISVAATYLKATHTPFKGYLEHLRDCNQNFIETQENVLKEGGKYAKTRYSIITLSLKQLIDVHPDFRNLLLLISLLNFQDIPRTLLDHYKNNVIVDNFIYNLKKYSLITDALPSASQTIPVFSIHQSTQEICLTYLTKTLNLQKNKEIFTEVSEILGNHINEITEKKVDFVYMRLLINHCEEFLSHQKYLSDSMVETLSGELGRIYLYLGNDKKAIYLLNKSIEYLTQYYHGNHPFIPRFLSYLGDAYFGLGDYKKSKELYEESLKIYRQHFPKNGGGIAYSLIGLATVYRGLGNYKSAKNLFEQGLTLYRKHLPDNHLAIAWALKHLGYSYKELGDYEKAKDLMEQSLSLYKKSYPQDSDEVNTWVQIDLGNLYRELGNYRKAKELFEKSLIVYKKNLPENHYKIARVLKYLGILYRELEDHKKEKEFLEKSLTIYEKDYPEGRYDIAIVLKYLGNSYRRVGNYKKSKEFLERSLLIQKNLLRNDDINLYSTYLFLGNLYVDLGRYEEAKNVIRKCLQAYEGYYGKNHIESLRALRYLGRAYFKEGDMKAAEAIFQKLFKISELFPADVHPYTYKHPHTYRLYEDLGILYHHFSLREMQSGNREAFQNYLQQARRYMAQALKIVKASHPKEAPIIARIESKLKSLENKELKSLKLE